MISGHVRFIGDIDKRVNEDFLRIIRFYRFSIYYAIPLIANNQNISEVPQKFKLFIFWKKIWWNKENFKLRKFTSKLIKKSVVKELKKLFEKSFDIKLNFNNFDKFCELEQN